MANDNYQLIVRRGPQPNQTFLLDKDVVTLGRDITNDIVINDPEVSRHHLRITRGAQGYNLEDLGSTNGTFMGGQRLSGVRPLNPGDMIGLGETVTLGYEMVRPEGGAPATVASPPQSQAPQAPEPQAPQPSYTPPMQSPPPQQQQPQADYAPPQPSYEQPQPDYAPPQPSYDQPDYGYNAPPQAPAGYEYDPYAVREEEGGNTLRWILIGCATIMIFCCCATVVGFVIIDALELWYDLPIIKDLAPLLEDIAGALGMT